MGSPQIIDGGPAFPGATETNGYGDGHHVVLPSGQIEWMTVKPGMSLRDWFAGKALQGGIASDAHPDVVIQETFEFAARAKWAYEMADAMLAERAKAVNS